MTRLRVFWFLFSDYKRTDEGDMNPLSVPYNVTSAEERQNDKKVLRL